MNYSSKKHLSSPSHRPVRHKLPFICILTSWSPQSVNTSPTAFLQQKLDILTPAQREEFFSLSYVLPGQNLSKSSLSQSELALAIFQTNGIQAGDRVGLFPRTARLNHGCSAAFNAVYSWREKEGNLVVHALKPIKAHQVRHLRFIRLPREGSRNFFNWHHVKHRNY